VFHKSLRILQNLFFVYLVTGCVSNPQKVVSPFTPTATNLSNNFTQVVSQETTSTPLAVETSPSETGNIQYSCLNIGIDDYQTMDIRGTLAFRNQESLSGDELLLINLNSGEQKKLTHHLVNLYTMSPKGSYLAFDSSDSNQEENRQLINVIDSSGESVVVVNKEKEWDRFEWLSEGELLVNVPNGNNPLIALSPFTGEEKSIEPFFTNAQRPSDQELIYAWGFFSYHKIVYNRDLTRAVYAVLEAGEPRIAIRDTTSSKDLASYPSYEAWGVSPKWSPNGEYLAIALNTNSSFRTDNIRQYELFIIDHNGNKIYSTSLFNSMKSLYISSLSWSPDNNYVAFWYTTENDIHQSLELAVLDVKTKAITNYCISKNEETHSWKRNDISPIWSPDSTALLVEIPDTNDQTPNSIIVNISQEKAIRVEPGMIPVGWMSSP